jgi:hypothetical protein
MVLFCCEGEGGAYGVKVCSCYWVRSSFVLANETAIEGRNDFTLTGTFVRNGTETKARGIEDEAARLETTI